MTQNDPISNDTLSQSLDKAATRLLSLAAGDQPPEGVSNAFTLAEQVKAFEAAMEWAKLRRDLYPPDKPKAKFDGIRAAFNGDKASGRRSGAAKAKAGPAVAYDPDANSAAASPGADDPEG